ncbi:MAG: SpoIID/LytB domain-containing protein [Rhodothermales bacterium]|nr:SpoIID/LytB domain-containing protein [Rhodothermales bacterium]
MKRYPGRLLAVVTVSLFLASPALSQEASNEITVRLFANSRPSSVSIVPSKGEAMLYARLDQDGIMTVLPGDTITVRPDALGLSVRAGDMDIHQTELHVRVSGDDGLVVGIAENGRSTIRRYPGTISIRKSAEQVLAITNTVQIEPYVASVVAKEYSLGDKEGTRAMAVLARTLAVRSILDSRQELVDGVGAQVYHGLDVVTEASREAANSTRGIVLMHKDEPVVAAYSASNGGHSARNSDVWSGESLPYLRARKDRFDRAASPYNDWLSRLSRERVHGALSQFTGASVTGLSVDSRSKDGRARTVKLKLQGAPDAELTGTEFRQVLTGRFGVSALRSTMFDVRTEDGNYVFEGSGFGHGVGLSQWGAHEMAERGYNFEEILHFYFAGTRTRSMDKLGFETGDQVAAVTPPTDDDDPSPRSTRRPRNGERGTTGGLRGWSASVGAPGTSSSDRDRVGW